MQETLYVDHPTAGTLEIPGMQVAKVFITVQLSDGKEYYFDVESIDIGHDRGVFHGKLGSISGNGNCRKVIR